MSNQKHDNDERTFGQELLGMQGFSAVRATRYREEISRLLNDQISLLERWAVGFFGVLFMFLLGVVPIAGLLHATVFEGFQDARITLLVMIGATGALLGGWMLRVGIKGGYGRHAGDWVGMMTSVIFCGGSAIAFTQIAWATDNSVLRTEMLFAGAMFFVFALGCLLFTSLRQMHRQTREKLLRIEYHLAELTERSIR